MDPIIAQQVEALLAQMTMAERAELYHMLAANQTIKFNPHRLNLTQEQTDELEKLKVEYVYQLNVAEIQLSKSASSEFLDTFAAAAKAKGAVEILDYLVQLFTTPYQPNAEE
jgi:hypothetical protein